MTDEEIIALRKSTRPADVTTPFADSIAFARAILERAAQIADSFDNAAHENLAVLVADAIRETK